LRKKFFKNLVCWRKIRVVVARAGALCAHPLKGGVWPSLPANASGNRKDLKCVLMVKVRALEILKLRTTRKKQAKDRPTPPILASKTEGKNRIQPGWIRKFISVRKAQLDEAT
jgi:hypothetical protein